MLAKSAQVECREWNRPDGWLWNVMNLVRAFRLRKNAQVAFVGAGGKTTALFQLARELTPPVVVTCSTHLGVWQADLADRHIIAARSKDIDGLAGQIEGVTLISGPPMEDQRLQGAGPDALDGIYQLASQLGFPVLVEADGSRQRPLKAPGENEPVIPDWVDTVVVVMGLSGIGRPLEAGTVHRPERFAELSGLRPGEPVTDESIAQVLLHSQGGQKGIPAGARKVALLNQADQPSLIDAGLRIANMVGRSFDAGIVASLSEKKIFRVVESAAGIILAGGGSSRLGQPKMLLRWRGQALIRHVTEAALAAGLDPVVVITGAIDQPIREALAGLPVLFVHNADWHAGQSTSLKAGLRVLPNNTGAALFLLADQPFITPDLVKGLIGRHQVTLAPAVAPRVDARRANPVLFDRDTFAGLLELEGDTGGRAILDRFSIEYIDWDDARILLDVDTQRDYDQLMALE